MALLVIRYYYPPLGQGETPSHGSVPHNSKIEFK